MKWFDLVKQFLPDVVDLVQFIMTIGDREFEEISKSWPTPIKTKMAKLRFEAKLLREFPDEGGES